VSLRLKPRATIAKSRRQLSTNPCSPPPPSLPFPFMASRNSQSMGGMEVESSHHPDLDKESFVSRVGSYALTDVGAGTFDQVKNDRGGDGGKGWRWSHLWCPVAYFSDLVLVLRPICWIWSCMLKPVHKCDATGASTIRRRDKRVEWCIPHPTCTSTR